MARISAGDRFPQMTVDTAYRKNVNIYELLGDKTVIWVLRYIGCTVCSPAAYQHCGNRIYHRAGLPDLFFYL